MRHLRQKILAVTACFLLFLCGGCVRPSLFVEGTEYDGLWRYEECDGTELSLSPCEKVRSVSFWFRPSDAEEHQPFFILNDGDQILSLNILSIQENTLRGTSLLVQNASMEREVFTEAGITLDMDRWNYIVVQQRGTGFVYYLNGREVLSLDHVAAFSGRDGKVTFPGKGRFSFLKAREVLLSEEEIAAEYNGKKAAVVLDGISFPDASRLERSLWFDGFEADGVPVEWEVMEQNLMDYRGEIFDLSTAADIHVLASVQLEESQAEKMFVFHVAGHSEQVRAEDDLRGLKADVGGVLHSGETLPSAGGKGSSFAWTVVSGDAVVQDGALIKTGTDEREEIELNVLVTSGSCQLSYTWQLILLDPVYGYALSYFDGEDVGHIALSEDGFSWKPSAVTIKAETGSGMVRDPMLSRTADGSFAVTATQGYNHPEIYLWQSADLVAFENERLIYVDYPDSGTGMSGECAWAPSLIYDNEEQQYLLLFSDPFEKGGIYCSSSGDLVHFSYPKLFFSPGYPVIDAEVFSWDGRYHMFYKDEREAALTVFYAEADDLETGFTDVHDRLFLYPEKGIEGPAVFRSHSGDWILIADCYGEHRFIEGTILWKESGVEIDWMDESAYSFPDDVRHGSVIALTEKEYTVIQKAE